MHRTRVTGVEVRGLSALAPVMGKLHWTGRSGRGEVGCYYSHVTRVDYHVQGLHVIVYKLTVLIRTFITIILRARANAYLPAISTTRRGFKS